MFRESHKFRIRTRKRLHEEQGGLCFYCKHKIKGKPTLDHIIPIDSIEEMSYREYRRTYRHNYVVACGHCNEAKGKHIVFSLLTDREIYVIVDVPYYFRARYIQTNNFK